MSTITPFISELLQARSSIQGQAVSGTVTPVSGEGFSGLLALFNVDKNSIDSKTAEIVTAENVAELGNNFLISNNIVEQNIILPVSEPSVFELADADLVSQNRLIENYDDIVQAASDYVDLPDIDVADSIDDVDIILDDVNLSSNKHKDIKNIFKNIEVTGNNFSSDRNNHENGIEIPGLKQIGKVAVSNNSVNSGIEAVSESLNLSQKNIINNTDPIIIKSLQASIVNLDKPKVIYDNVLDIELDSKLNLLRKDTKLLDNNVADEIEVLTQFNSLPITITTPLSPKELNTKPAFEVKKEEAQNIEPATAITSREFAGLQQVSNNSSEVLVSDNLYRQATKAYAQHTPAAQVSLQILANVRHGDNIINIQLEPRELGKVDIVMELKADGKTDIVIRADNKDTLELLRADSSILEKSLNDAGIKTESGAINFNLKHDQQQSAKHQQHQQTQNNHHHHVKQPEVQESLHIAGRFETISTSNTALNILV